ncbi:MAG: cell wall-recycling L,D-carboxypeptidase ElsL [Acinetobacter sp.]|nr:cell wall-recycling L,D-carboxypeptidase ElsL [Acinetobacter sp.]
MTSISQHTIPNTIYDADVLIDLAQQMLHLPKHGKSYPISSGKNGIGEQENSGKTPRGWHMVAEKFGHHAPIYSVFVARQATGEIYNDDLAQNHPERDWILSRILWLQGLEQGFNAGEGCDTKQRYIYLHGTPDTAAMGTPLSHGCIRMRNHDIVELFDLIDEDASVYLSEQEIHFTT